VEKDRVLEDIRVTSGELDSVIIPSYGYAADFFRTSKLRSDKNKELSSQFYRNFDDKSVSKQASFIGDIQKRLSNVKLNLEYVQGTLENVAERDMINEGLTAKKAVLIRAVEHMSYISRYSGDLLNYVYSYEAAGTGATVDESMAVSVTTVRNIEKNIGNYARLLSKYGQPNKDFSKEMELIPDIVLSTRGSEAIRGMYNETEVDPYASAMTVGFTYSPIYHIRMVVAEWQANRYKANKDKKKVLELRLLHLKMQTDQKNDPKLQQEIEYTQNRIDKIEHYLREVEDSLEGN
jgi:hypothetical protein